MTEQYGQGDQSTDPYSGGSVNAFSESDEQNLRLLLNISSESPYYDDYNELKQFVKILFHPGRAVQARELTQIQTILQDQIARFGSHIFKDGSSLQSGGVASVPCYFIRVENIEGGTIEDFIGTEVSIYGDTNDTSPVAKVVHAMGEGGTNDPYAVLFVEYSGGDDIYEGDEVLVANHPSIANLTCDVRQTGTDMEDLDGVYTTGLATLVRIEEGIYFISGYFVLTESQTIPLYALSQKYQSEHTLVSGLGRDDALEGVRLFSAPTSKIGLRINSEVVSASDDESLKDPANGFYNYNAPGADRLKIQPLLVQIPFIYTAEYNTSITTYGEVTADFIEVIRIENGITVWQRKNPIYSDLGHTLARRTYDESGSYTVRPFELTMKNHLRDDSYKIYCNTGLVTTTDATDSTEESFSSSVKIGNVLEGSLSGVRGTIDDIEIYKFTGTDPDDDPYPNSDSIITVKMIIQDSDGIDIIGGYRFFENDDLEVVGSTDGAIITIVDSIKFVADSTGAFTFAEGGNADLLAGQIGPGKAYVYGYEHEVLSSRTIPINKGRTTDSVVDYNVVTNIGNYVNVTFPEGTTKFGNWDSDSFNLNQHPLMNLANSKWRTIEFPFQEEHHADGECIFWAPLKATEHDDIFDSVLFVGADPDGDPASACNDGTTGCFGNIYNSTITGEVGGASYKVKSMSGGDSSVTGLKSNIKRIVFADKYNEGINFTTVQDLVEAGTHTEAEAIADPSVKIYQMDNALIDNDEFNPTSSRGGIVAQGIAYRWVPASATGSRMGSVLFVEELYGKFQYQEDTGNTEIGMENTGGVIFQNSNNLPSYGSSIREVKEVVFVQQLTTLENYSDTGIGTYEIGDNIRQKNIASDGVLRYATGKVIGIGQVASGDTDCDKLRIWVDVDGAINESTDKFRPSIAGTYDGTFFSEIGPIEKINDDGTTCIEYNIAENGEETLEDSVQQIFFREPYISNAEYFFNEEVLQHNPAYAGEHALYPGGDSPDASQRDCRALVLSWNVGGEYSNLYILNTQNVFERDHGAVFQQPFGSTTALDPELGRMGWVGIISISEPTTGFFINLKNTYGGLGDIDDYIESETLTQIKIDIESSNYIAGKDYTVGSVVTQSIGDGTEDYASGVVISWEHRDTDDATDTRSSLLQVVMDEGSAEFIVGASQETTFGRILETTTPPNEPTGNESGYNVTEAEHVKKVIGTARLRQFSAKDNDEYWAHFYDIKMKLPYEFGNVDSFYESTTESDRRIVSGDSLVFRGHPVEGFIDGRLRIYGSINRAIFPLPIGDVAKTVAKADYRIQKSYEVAFSGSANPTAEISTEHPTVRFVGGTGSTQTVLGMNLEHYLLIADDGTIVDLSSSEISVSTNNNDSASDGTVSIVGTSDSGLGGWTGTLIATNDVNPGTQSGEAILSNYRKKTYTSSSSTINLEKNYDNGMWEAQIPQADIKSLVYIKDSNAKTVTDWFDFDNGLTDNLYDWATLTLKPKYVEDNVPQVAFDGDVASLTVKYRYFNHTGSGPLFVNSYTHSSSNMTFDDIGVYVSKQTGDAYPLNTCIDCRPTRSSEGTIDNVWLPKAGEAFDVNYTYYIGRYDKMILNSTGEFAIIEGIPNLYPVSPDPIDNIMDLYVIKIPPYTYSPDDIKLRYIENKRYTMRDIGVIERRVQALEYYTSLSLLEKETEDLFIDDGSGNNRFKLGTLVDNFTGHSVGDVRNPDYNCSIDRQHHNLRCKFTSSNFDFIPDTAFNTSLIRTNDNLYHIPFTHQVHEYQPLVSTKFNLNPYDIIDWQGKIILNPSNDNWVDTKKGANVRVNLAGENDNWDAMGPQAMGTDWNDWETNWTGTETAARQTTTTTPNPANPSWGIPFGAGTPTVSTITRTTTTTTQAQSRTGIKTMLVPERVTKSLGNRVVDVSIAKYMRSRPITIGAWGLKPNCTVWPYFDEIQVAENCTVNGSSIAETGIVTDANGTVEGLVFTIPEGEFLTGEKVFKLIDNKINQMQLVTTSAEADFLATGLVQTKSAVSVTVRTFKIVKENVTAERTKVDDKEAYAVQTTPGGPIIGQPPRPRPPGRPCANGAWAQSIRSVFPASTLLTGLRNCPPIVRPPPRPTRRSPVGRHRRSGRPVRRTDPLAQTFFVSAEEHPDGIYLTKMNFWFASKGEVPVALQIRPVVNGYPHSSAVLPFGEEILNADDIKASSDIPNILDETNATTWTFQTPVHLVAGQEYAVVLLANSNKYEIYGSTMGQEDLNSGDVISKQPSLGSMFKSQNSLTWTADQASDLMFVIYHAEFDTTTEYDAVFTEDTDIADEDETTVAYDVYNMSVNTAEHATSSVEWSIATTPNVADAVISDIFTPFQVKTNHYLTTPSKVVLDSDDSTLRIKTKFQTDNPDVSAMIDMERFGFIAVNNRIENNNDINIESESYNGELDPQAFLSPSATGVNRARYVSRLINLEEGFEGTNVTLMLTANKPAGTNIQTFIKYQRPEDDRPFDKLPWVPLTQMSEDFVSPNTTQMTEIKYQLETDINEPYGKYSIKICLYSGNSSVVPRVKDLRAIAVL